MLSLAEGKAVNSWFPSFYFNMTDPSSWHPLNYKFTDTEISFGVGWDKVDEKHKN